MSRALNRVGCQPESENTCVRYRCYIFGEPTNRAVSSVRVLHDWVAATWTVTALRNEVGRHHNRAFNRDVFADPLARIFDDFSAP